MKFYYNGKLIRTSKTREYKFAIIGAGTDSCFSCHETREAAQAAKSRAISDVRSHMENGKSALEALRKGRTGFYAKEGRRTYYIKFTKWHTEENLLQEIAECEQRIKNIADGFQIVEIEARA